MKNTRLFRKSLVFFVAMMLVVLSELRAQRFNRKEEIDSMKIGFFTKELQLTEAEAQKFWPIFNAYEQERKNINQKRRQLMMKNGRDTQSLSDKDAEIIIQQYIELENIEFELRKKYIQKFREALSPAKIVMLLRAEKKFGRLIARKIREHQSPSPPKH